MSIQSISSGANSLALGKQPVAENKQSTEVKQIERQLAQVAELERRKEEAPKVVVNAQGQPTGTLISAIA
jgi:hypothetical protein